MDDERFYRIEAQMNALASMVSAALVLAAKTRAEFERTTVDRQIEELFTPLEASLRIEIEKLSASRDVGHGPGYAHDFGTTVRQVMDKVRNHKVPSPGGHGG